jgi:hypothetical protein
MGGSYSTERRTRTGRWRARRRNGETRQASKGPKHGVATWTFTDQYLTDMTLHVRKRHQRPRSQLPPTHVLGSRTLRENAGLSTSYSNTCLSTDNGYSHYWCALFKLSHPCQSLRSRKSAESTGTRSIAFSGRSPEPRSECGVTTGASCERAIFCLVGRNSLLRRQQQWLVSAVRVRCGNCFYGGAGRHRRNSVLQQERDNPGRGTAGPHLGQLMLG